MRLLGIERAPGWALALVAILPVLVATPVGLPFLLKTPWIFNGLMLICAAWAMVVGGVWWSRLDEASHEAHKFAWLWGGSTGLSLAILSIFAIEASHPFADFISRAALGVRGWRPGPAGFMLGVTTAGLASIAGYLLAWAAWWILRKTPR